MTGGFTPQSRESEEEIERVENELERQEHAPEEEIEGVEDEAEED